MPNPGRPTRRERKILVVLFAIMAVLGVLSVIKYGLRGDEWAAIMNAFQIVIGIAGVWLMLDRLRSDH